MTDKAERLSRKYLLATTVAVAGVNPVTFNAWRNRNGLFPRTKGEQGWKYYSLADICVTATVRRLTAAGLNTQMAVDWAMALLPRFEAMALAEDDDVFESVVATFTRGFGDDADFDVEFSSPNRRRIFGTKSENIGVSVSVDLLLIFDGVIKELAALQPETIVEGKAAQAVFFSAMSDALEKAMKKLEQDDEE